MVCAFGRRLPFVVLAVLAACTARRARAEFANAHHCNEQLVTVTPQGKEHFRVSGCGYEEDLDCRSLPCMPARREKKRALEPATLPVAAEVDLTPLENARGKEVRSCYEQAWKTNPTLSGYFFLEFTIATDGRVQDAKVVRSTVHDQTLEVCVTKRVAAVRFASRDQPAHMSVPFVVRP